MHLLSLPSSPCRALPMALLIAAFVAACSSAPTYNPTTFDYELKEEQLEAAPIKTVVIAPVNIGNPSRNYLQDHEDRVDSMVAAYLKENGYRVLPSRVFEQEWNTASRVYGNVYDPTTGEVNRKTFSLTMIAVRDELQKKQNVDAIIFTDLLEQEVQFSAGLNHVARWHGVTRKPVLQGPGDGVSAGFDWSRPLTAASLWVSVYNMELQRVFTSIGGLDTTQAIDTRSSSGRYVRRRSMLESEGHISEGIQLAFHPLIPMKKYPGEPST
ncbi:MAG: hypothetical protein AAGI24_13895 [Pseudomonadota bacterium]